MEKYCAVRTFKENGKLPEYPYFWLEHEEDFEDGLKMQFTGSKTKIRVCIHCGCLHQSSQYNSEKSINREV